MKLIIIDTQGETNFSNQDIEALQDAVDYIHPDSYEYGSMSDRQYRCHLQIAKGADAVKIKLIEAIKHCTVTSANFTDWFTKFIDENFEEIQLDWKHLGLKDRISLLKKLQSIFDH